MQKREKQTVKPVTIAACERLFKDHLSDKKLRWRMRNLLKKEEDSLIIVTPHLLAKSEIDTVIQKLGLSSATNLEVENKVEPGLLAGMVVKFKNHFFDFSLKGQLDSITESFI